MSAEHVSGLVCVKVEQIKQRLNSKFTITNSTHPACGSLREGTEYGYFDQPTWPLGDEKTSRKHPLPTRQTDLHPWFRCVDEDAVILGEFSANGEPAYVYRDCGNWHSLYHGPKVLRREILKAAARFSGCHVYSETDDVIYAGRNFVTIHAKTGGRKRIALPEKSDAFEVYQYAVYGRNTDAIELDMPAGHTRTFYLHGRI
jgi:hypothetical protein